MRDKATILAETIVSDIEALESNAAAGGRTVPLHRKLAHLAWRLGDTVLVNRPADFVEIPSVCALLINSVADDAIDERIPLVVEFLRAQWPELAAPPDDGIEFSDRAWTFQHYFVVLTARFMEVSSLSSDDEIDDHFAELQADRWITAWQTDKSLPLPREISVRLELRDRFLHGLALYAITRDTQGATLGEYLGYALIDEWYRFGRQIARD